MPKKTKDLGVNPLAEKFPLMTDDQLAELVADIQANGLREAGQLDAEGRILDGRNRYLACRTCLPPIVMRWRKWRGSGSPEKYAAYVISYNLCRRHQPLTAAQRSILAAEIAESVGVQIGRPISGNKSATVADFLATAKLAERADVSARSLHEARKVLREHPEAVEDVKAGRTTAHAVLREAAKAEEAARAEQPDAIDEDCLGNGLPERIGAVFGLAEKLDGWKRSLEAIRRDVESAVGDKEPIVAFVRLQQFQSEIRGACAVLRFALPYCLCPYCGGDGKCKTCNDAGWLPKELYAAAVPAEMKWENRK